MLWSKSNNQVGPSLGLVVDRILRDVLVQTEGQWNN